MNGMASKIEEAYDAQSQCTVNFMTKTRHHLGEFKLL